MNKGDCVIAISTGDNTLTKGKPYLILDGDFINSDPLVIVKNDNGISQWYYSSRFILTDEENE
ncbi:MAG: hypothetical protein ACRCVU_13765 [Flavobacterium sp.]